MNEARIPYRVLKVRFREGLVGSDFTHAMALLEAVPARQAVNPLMSFFCSGDLLLRWRAVSGMGVVVSRLADSEMESARVIMRRLMWTLNDESGGIGWGAPEAMGEITARHATLASEFACILVSYIRPDCNFLEHPVLQRGVLWGLGRLAHARPELAADAAPFIHPFLTSSDAVHRGHAAWALRALGHEQLEEQAASLSRDSASFLFYMDGQLQEVSVAELASGKPPAG
mgnify:CR=1 FL=1